jgi:hypothetical protein
MLTETMTPSEITNEIKTDWKKVINSLERLFREYNHARKKNHISKKENFEKAYEIKTARKNNWIIIFTKSLSENFKAIDSVTICALIYYFDSTGIRVFRLMTEDGFSLDDLSVYNERFFSQYKERMNLVLTNPLDIVKHFFLNNWHFDSKEIKKDDKVLTISTCKEGYLIGELQNSENWNVSKTFISKRLIGTDQAIIENDLNKILQNDVNE